LTALCAAMKASIRANIGVEGSHSASRDSLASVTLDMNRTLYGVTASAVAKYDSSSVLDGLRDSLASVSLDMNRTLYGVTPSALAKYDGSSVLDGLRDSLASVSLDMNRALYGVTASALAKYDASSVLDGLRDSLASVSLDMNRALYGVTASALAEYDASSVLDGLRDSLASVSLDMSRTLYGVTGSALAKYDASGVLNGLRDSLASVSLDMSRTLYGLTGSALAKYDASSVLNGLRDSLASVSLDMNRTLYGVTGSALADFDASEFFDSAHSSIVRPQPAFISRVPHRARRVVPLPVANLVERLHEFVEQEDLSILITFPAANERGVLLSVVQMTAAYRLLHCFEVRLREVISSLMESKFGLEWMRTRVSPKIVALWEEKRTIAERKGFPSSHLLDYADFSDYLGIIVQRSNWREVFQSIFGNQKDTEVSFERLQPLRIETMHNRRLSRADAAVLATEVYRLLAKLDRSQLN
jgi:hypothetical protein